MTATVEGTVILYKQQLGYEKVIVLVSAMRDQLQVGTNQARRFMCRVVGSRRSL